MLQSELQVRVLSPERIIFRGPAKALGLPGELGYMTLLPGHTPMVAELGIGTLVLESGSTSAEKLFVSGGFVDVSRDAVTVLANVIEKPTEINVDRAKKALIKAEEQLLQAKSGGVDVPRALSAKKRAEHRLEIAGATKALH
jgi:F-type H+-transporting ATPase subunit epsilon